METISAGEFAYEVVEGWGKLPEGWRFTQVAGVAVDSHDRVYRFTNISNASVSEAKARFTNSSSENYT